MITTLTTASSCIPYNREVLTSRPFSFYLLASLYFYVVSNSVIDTFTDRTFMSWFNALQFWFKKEESERQLQAFQIKGTWEIFQKCCLRCSYLIDFNPYVLQIGIHILSHYRYLSVCTQSNFIFRSISINIYLI